MSESPPGNSRFGKQAKFVVTQERWPVTPVVGILTGRSEVQNLNTSNTKVHPANIIFYINDDDDTSILEKQWASVTAATEMGLVQRSLHATATGLQHPYARDTDSAGTCTHSKQKLRSAHHFVGENVPEIHSKSSSRNRRLRSSWLPQYSRS